jgi:hypothetical protein
MAAKQARPDDRGMSNARQSARRRRSPARTVSARMTPSRGDGATAETLLGRDHRLTAALTDVTASVKQAGGAATAAGVGLVAHAAGSSFGTALALAAVLVAMVLAGRLCIALDRARQRACDVIIEGGEDLPVALVQRQRHRLLSSDLHAMLASMYEDLARRAERPSLRAPDGPAAVAAPLGGLGEDLRAVAGILRGDAPDARDVALAERLVDDQTSPLYGADVDALRRALHRIARHADRRPAALRCG